MHTVFKALKHFSYLFDLEQLVKQATRVTSTSESIIDLIFVSDPNKIYQSGTTVKVVIFTRVMFRASAICDFFACF